MGLANMIADYERDIQRVQARIAELRGQREMTRGTKRYELSRRICSLEDSLHDLVTAVEAMREYTAPPDKTHYASHKSRGRLYDRKQW